MDQGTGSCVPASLWGISRLADLREQPARWKRVLNYVCLWVYAGSVYKQSIPQHNGAEEKPLAAKSWVTYNATYNIILISWWGEILLGGAYWIIKKGNYLQATTYIAGRLHLYSGSISFLYHWHRLWPSSRIHSTVVTYITFIFQPLQPLQSLHNGSKSFASPSPRPHPPSQWGRPWIKDVAQGHQVFFFSPGEATDLHWPELLPVNLNAHLEFTRLHKITDNIFSSMWLPRLLIPDKGGNNWTYGFPIKTDTLCHSKIYWNLNSQ